MYVTQSSSSMSFTNQISGVEFQHDGSKASREAAHCDACNSVATVLHDLDLAKDKTYGVEELQNLYVEFKTKQEQQQ